MKKVQKFKSFWFEGFSIAKVNTSDVIFLKEYLVLVFSERQHNRWKVKVNDHLFEDEFGSLHKLYEDIYACSPPNGDYPNIFLKGWLAYRSGKVVNWVCYAYDTTKEQIKRAKMHPSSQSLIPQP
jgi:hypothetical protein